MAEPRDPILNRIYKMEAVKEQARIDFKNELEKRQKDKKAQRAVLYGLITLVIALFILYGSYRMFQPLFR